MHWNLRGPVRALRTEWAEWDLTHGHWLAPGRFSMTRFRADGSISESEEHNPNGSVSKSRYIYDETGRLRELQFQMDDGLVSKTCHHYDSLGRPTRTTILQSEGTERETEIWKYDDNGRKTKVQIVPKIESPGCGMLFGIDGTDQGYGAENVAQIETLYDDSEQPSGALFYDAAGAIVLRVVFTRDAAGRLLSEEKQVGDKLPLGFEQYLATVNAEERAAASAAIARFATMRTTYRYDEQGRRVERCTSMSELGERRTTWHYDEHDNPAREVEEDVSREMQPDESGNFQVTNEKRLKSEFRSDYKYDEQGNWTERVVSIRYETNPGFQPSNIERREITYGPGA